MTESSWKTTRLKILAGVAVFALWSCAPSAEPPEPQRQSTNSAVATATASGSSQQSPSAPSEGATALRSGERIRLCGHDEFVFELAGEVRGDQLILRADCLGRGRQRPSTEFSVLLSAPRLAAAGQARPLLNLWRPPVAFRQRLDSAVDGRFIDIKLVTGTSHCPVIRATPLAEPPVPPRFLERYQRWSRAFAFHADADCSVLVIGIGNEIVVLEKNIPRRARLFGLRLDFIGGTNGQSSF